MLDRCQSAPATLDKATTPELGRHQLPQSLSTAGILPLPPPPPPPPSQPSTELVPPASMQPNPEDLPEVTEADTASDDTSTLTPAPPNVDGDSPVQAMEEEETEPCPADPDQVEMECPPDPQSAPVTATSSEGEAVPSLAAALMELHELLVSNTQMQPPDRSPPHQPATGTDHVRPGPEAAEVGTTMAGTIPAQVDQAPELDVRDRLLAGRQLPPQQPGNLEEKVASVFQPVPEAPSDLLEHPATAEPHQPPAVTSDPSLLQPEDTSLSPLPMVVDSPGGVSPNSSSQPHVNPPGAPPIAPDPPRTSTPPTNPPENALPPSPPLIDQFPAEHIQQIQAAGFSAVEAAEALERAHGVVELALLVLLARSITVPT